MASRIKKKTYNTQVSSATYRNEKKKTVYIKSGVVISHFHTHI